MMTLFAIPLFAIALGAVLCSRHTRPDRNYYPMQRVMWFVLAAIYGGSGTAALFGTTTRPTVRVVFTLLMLGAVLYSLGFIHKRNRTPRFLALTLGGDIIVTPVAELERAALLVESWAHHGAMTEERALALEAALAEWRAKRAWAQGLARSARARREAKERGE